MKIKVKIIKKLWDFFWDNKKLMFKYAAVGAMSAVVDFGVLFVLTDWFGVYYLVSATASFILSR